MNALEIMQRVERGELTPDEGDYELLVIEEKRDRRKRFWRTVAECLTLVGIGVMFLLSVLADLIPWPWGE